MIYKDEDGDRWLRCDGCAAQGRDDIEFWGTGLTTNKLVRACAASLEGWRRRSILTRLEPEIEWIWLDLCSWCATPQGMAVLLWAAAIAMEEDDE